MSDVLEMPRKKYFRVQKLVMAGKQHLAKRKKSGVFKSLCGRTFDPQESFGVEISYAEPGICKRCLYCRTKTTRRGYFPERLVRVFISREEEWLYWELRKPLAETEHGKALLARISAQADASGA
jgi:hypothetical protein